MSPFEADAPGQIESVLGSGNGQHWRHASATAHAFLNWTPPLGQKRTWLTGFPGFAFPVTDRAQSVRENTRSGLEQVDKNRETPSTTRKCLRELGCQKSGETAEIAVNQNGAARASTTPTKAWT